MLAGRVHDLVDLLIGEADDGSHAALDAPLLHDPATLAHQPDRRLEVDCVGSHRCRVLAGRMPGEAQRRQLDAGLVRLRAHRLEVRDAGGQDGRLRVHRQVELLGRALGDHPRQRKAKRGIGSLDDRGSDRRALEQGGPHPDVLRALAGEDEGVRGRRCGRGCGIGVVGHSHLSVV